MNRSSVVFFFLGGVLWHRCVPKSFAHLNGQGAATGRDLGTYFFVLPANLYPPPLVLTQDPAFPHFLAFWGGLSFLRSNPIENVVCSLVQVAGTVNMGVKVLL